GAGGQLRGDRRPAAARGHREAVRAARAGTARRTPGGGGAGARAELPDLPQAAGGLRQSAPLDGTGPASTGGQPARDCEQRRDGGRGLRHARAAQRTSLWSVAERGGAPSYGAGAGVAQQDEGVGQLLIGETGGRLAGGLAQRLPLHEERLQQSAVQRRMLG